MQVSDFHYDLPGELIAQMPPVRRGDSRMLVVSRATQTFRDEQFANFPSYLHPGDCLVLNNTRVFPARLLGHKTNGGGRPVEVFLLRARNLAETEWLALVKPGKHLRAGDRIFFDDELSATILNQGAYGERTIELHAARPVLEVLDRFGTIPLPPYIRRAPGTDDRERYQTVFGEKRGSVAAPTAGLHFTPEMLERCGEAGADRASITLHVGLGTFGPLRTDRVQDIQLHEEYFEISGDAAAQIANANRRVCVGTTAVRTVETAMLRGGLTAMTGDTNLFIYPGFRFRATGALLTNFHLPASSLLMLVSAFAGKDLALAAYRHAVAERYRFFSYGDCMLIE